MKSKTPWGPERKEKIVLKNLKEKKTKRNL